MNRSTALAFSALVTVTLTAIAPARADDRYVVKDGDTCMKIAVEVLGDRRKLPTLHRLNPQLGKLPHVLVAGQVLALPPTDRGADAQLTGKIGDVRFRTSTDPAWDAARRGMDLFRAWAVGAETRASAEVTFRDRQQLFLREHTVVVIYGPELRRARTSSPEAMLERGTLRTRLAELSGKPVTITTPSAEATVDRGSALVGVDDAALTTVANHDGKPVDLRGAAGGRVAVKSGMGTRVPKDQPPEPPRPLPPAPTWTSTDTRFVAVDGKASVRATWAAVATAAAYRFEVARGTSVVAAGEVPAPVTELIVKNTPPGDYQVTVASIDGDRLEGKPSAPLPLTVRGIAVANPGTDLPGFAAPTGDDEPIAAPTLDQTFPMAAVGARLVAGGGLLCGTSEGVWEAITMVRETGVQQVRCVDSDGAAYAPVTIEVENVDLVTTPALTAIVRGTTVDVELAVRSIVPIGDAWQVEPSPGLGLEATPLAGGGQHVRVHAEPDAPGHAMLRVVDATTQRTIGAIYLAIDSPPRPPPRVIAPVVDVVSPPAPAVRPLAAVAAFAGILGLPDDNQLGDPTRADDVLDSLPVFGVRAARWLTGPWLVEGEAVLGPGHFTVDGDRAWVVGLRVQAGRTLATHDRVELRGLAGGGATVIRTDAPMATDDVDLDLAYGLALTYGLGDVHFRVDGRHRVVPDRSDGLSSAFELTAGVEWWPLRR